MNGRKSCYLILSFFACAWFFSGCGYHLKSAGEPVGIEIKSLAIPLMSSTASSAGFETDFTKLVRQEFVSHGKVPLVPEANAQAVIKGHIYEIKTEPISYKVTETTVGGEKTTYEVTSTRRIKIAMSASMLDKTTGQTIWEEDNLRERASYKVTDDPLRNRHNEREAVMDMAERIARRIFQKTMERF
jgi:hypothetical protein